MKKLIGQVIGIAILLACCFGLDFLTAWPLMWCWNHAVCEITTGLGPLDYWRAFCLLIVGHLLWNRPRNN